MDVELPELLEELGQVSDRRVAEDLAIPVRAGGQPLRQVRHQLAELGDERVVDVERLGEEGAVARRIQDPGHAQYALARKPGHRLRDVAHHVEGIGHHDDDRAGRRLRHLLRDRLHQAILAGQRERKPLALLVVDLDRFNEINDTLGHKNGDLVLRAVGVRLLEGLRKSDTVARLAGDRFAVMLPMTGVEGSIEAAQKIAKRLEEPFFLEELALDVEVSVGISLFPDHGEEAELLIRRADVAISLARQSGNGYAVYVSERDQHSTRRLALLGQLRQAIETGQLILYYQPKIDLRSGRVIGVEALVRWIHPEFGLIPPDEFIAPAEKSGLIRPLTLWVVEAALRQCRAWREEGRAFSVSVNVSARNLLDSQFPDQVAGLLQTHGVSPSQLELEITESAIMADPSKALEILRRFNQTGISLSIDDFGTGYSSLGYLRKLPVDTIKIDKSFVKNMTMDENDAMIVRSTIDLGHHLGLKVIAEGVENQEIWNHLVLVGCDAAQGYHISRPIPAAEMGRWLAELAPQKGWIVGTTRDRNPR